MIRNILRVLALTAILAVAGNHDANAQAANYTCQIIMSSAGVSNNSPSGVCAIDPTRMTNGAGVGLLLNFSAGASATASVQVTGDVPVNSTGAGLWNNHDTLVSETASANGNIQFPVTAVRLNVTAYSSGTVTLTVIQPAIPK